MDVRCGSRADRAIPFYRGAPWDVTDLGSPTKEKLRDTGDCALLGVRNGAVAGGVSPKGHYSSGIWFAIAYDPVRLLSAGIQNEDRWLSFADTCRKLC